MIDIKIDGKEIQVPEGKNLLDCALEAGIYIPHLCHHPDLPEHGSCRLCIVEVAGMEGTHTSCTLMPEAGMEITTHSQRIGKLRNLAMELLLAGHPKECTGCPKYGNCELQTLIQYIGANNSRMKDRSKGFKPEEENPLITHDMNRCVLCGRCVRACKDLRGVGILGFQKKDMESYVGTLQQKLLAEADCRFCGACAEVCPTGTIRDKLPALSEGKTREELIVPCKAACPAHTDVPRYVRLVKEGRNSEAAAVIREKVPMPKVLGYICNHACEYDCKRKQLNASVSIRNIKRFAAEHDDGSIWRPRLKKLPDTGKKVCVIGAGPAGLSAAYYLRKQGHAVVVKEALPAAGGMTRYGIPAYRLPKEVLEEEIGIMQETGFSIETGVRIEQPKALLGEYDAVVMATGSHQGVRLPMEGAALPQVLVNTEFLRAAAMGETTNLGKRVIVLGGGNVAFDCARSAVRLGAEEVHLVCLEKREVMTADEEEIHQAAEEGVFLHPGHTFEQITGTDCVTGADFMEVEDFSFDENRRPVIVKKENSASHIVADTIIFAVGQRPDLTEDCGLTLGRGNTIQVKDHSLETETEGLFAAGDVVYGTKSVVMAVASGKDVAREVDVYLGGDGNIEEILMEAETPSALIGRQPDFAALTREESELLFPEIRKTGFQKMDMGIPEEHICDETSRCLQCDLRLQITRPRLWGDYLEGKEA